MNDLERPIPEDNESCLKNILGIGPQEEVPENIRQLYWDISRTARKLGYAVSHHELILIALIANRPVQESPVTFLDVIKDDRVKRDDRVLAKFRGKWRWGWYKTLKGSSIIVQVDDDSSEEREFKPTAVRLPTSEELAEIGT